MSRTTLVPSLVVGRYCSPRPPLCFNCDWRHWVQGGLQYPVYRIASQT